MLNRLERVLKRPEVRIIQNSKWPPFLLEQIIFLFISSFIIDTGSPCARIGHHVPTISLRFNQGLPGNVVSDVTRNDFKWPP